MIGTRPVISGKELTPKNQRLQIDLEHRLNRWFQETSNSIGEALHQKYPNANKFAKADDDQDDGLQTELLVGGKRIPKEQSNIIRAMALLCWGSIKWDALVAIFQPYLQAAGEEGVNVGVGQVQMQDAVQSRHNASEEVEEQSKTRSAELAGMKYTEDDKLVEDPDAHWSLTEVMRRDLESTITLAVTENWTTSQLAAVIEASYAFSSERATIIAETELTNAQSGGTYSLWRSSGTVTLVRWRTADKDRQIDECDACEAQGIVPLGHEFAPKVFAPRLHPFCECELEVVDPTEISDSVEL